MITWPATTFAAKRTVKVIGRIKVLINSIKKSKIVIGNGEPSGIQWEKNILKFITE